MDFNNQQLDLDGPVGVIRIDRPGSLNSLSLETLDELITVAAECNDHPQLGDEESRRLAYEYLSGFTKASPGNAG